MQIPLWKVWCHKAKRCLGREGRAAEGLSPRLAYNSAHDGDVLLWCQICSLPFFRVVLNFHVLLCVSLPPGQAGQQEQFPVALCKWQLGQETGWRQISLFFLHCPSLQAVFQDFEAVCELESIWESVCTQPASVVELPILDTCMVSSARLLVGISDLECKV